MHRKTLERVRDGGGGSSQSRRDGRSLRERSWMALALHASIQSPEQKKLFIVYISHSLGTILQNSAKLLIAPQRDSIPENTANRLTEQEGVPHTPKDGGTILSKAKSGFKKH